MVRCALKSAAIGFIAAQMLAVRVVPPMAMSARRTTSSMLSSGRTGMPSLADHFTADARLFTKGPLQEMVAVSFAF